MADEKFKITWIDRFREPTEPPDPNYPDGKDVVAPFRAAAICKVSVPYPAPRCGMYVILCAQCGSRAALTTAGRTDDPKSVEIVCLRTLH